LTFEFDSSLVEETASLSPLNLLFFVAAGLLLLVSGGVLYLTAVEWRDRRRQSRDKKEAKGKGKR